MFYVALLMFLRNEMCSFLLKSLHPHVQTLCAYKSYFCHVDLSYIFRSHWQEISLLQLQRDVHERAPPVEYACVYFVKMASKAVGDSDPERLLRPH